MPGFDLGSEPNTALTTAVTRIGLECFFRNYADAVNPQALDLQFSP
jgi:hypothetical protein